MTTTSSRPHSTTRWRCDCGRIATGPDCACGARAPWVDTATAHDDADDFTAIDDHDLAPTPAPSDDPVRRHLADRLAGYRYRQASWLAGRFQALALATRRGDARVRAACIAAITGRLMGEEGEE